MLISDVLYISAIALCVKESVRTEVVHNLEDGRTAVLDLRQISLPGLAPPPFSVQESLEGSLVDLVAQRGRVAETAATEILVLRVWCPVT